MLLAQAELVNPGSLTPQQQQALSAAQAFKDQVFNTSDPANGLVPMEVVGGAGGGRDWFNIIDHDRWNYLEIKEDLLGHIVALKDILGI